MITTAKSIKLVGIESVPVTIECEAAPGVGIHLAGLADVAVKESLLRTVTALQGQDYRIPGQKIVVNIAPADLRKTGYGYDLPIALSLLSASGQEDLPELNRFIILGELSLNAFVRPVPGCVQAVQAALADESVKGVIIPADNASEVAAVFANAIPVYGVNTLAEALDIVKGTSTKETCWEEYLAAPSGPAPEETPEESPEETLWRSLSPATRRGLEIAAAGGHNVLLVSDDEDTSVRLDAAICLASIFPRPTAEDAETIAAIYSASPVKAPARDLVPFCAPRESLSIPALVGGGGGYAIRPGEVTLAHKGVLFLDRAETMERSKQNTIADIAKDRKVIIHRLYFNAEMPADTLIALGTTESGAHRLQSELTSRIGVHVLVSRLAEPQSGDLGDESLEAARDRVALARSLQSIRYQDAPQKTNGSAPTLAPEEAFALPSGPKVHFDALFETLLPESDREALIRIARTVADLSGDEHITPDALIEAATYRYLYRRRAA